VPTIFSAIFPDEIKMPVQNVQVLLDSYRERQKTGVIRLGYASDKQLCLLFKRGEWLNAYLVTLEKWEALSAERGAEWALAAGDAYAKSVPLSTFGLLTAKLLMQSRGASTEVFVRQTQITEHLASFSGRDEAALVHLAWKNAAGVIFFAPRSDPRFSFISQEMILDEAGSYAALCEWREPECAVTVFPPDLSVEAWQEYYLRSAFLSICENSLARFEALTGRALVDSLVRLVNVFTRRQNLEISITSRKLTDNEAFASPPQALYAYRLLLAELFDHFSAVIGPRLYASTLREIMKNLPKHEYEIARNFELLPKGYFYE
jgi:hypothetical protein